MVCPLVSLFINKLGMVVLAIKQAYWFTTKILVFRKEHAINWRDDDENSASGFSLKKCSDKIELFDMGFTPGGVC
jgi:hypothetical protein